MHMCGANGYVVDWPRDQGVAVSIPDDHQLSDQMALDKLLMPKGPLFTRQYELFGGIIVSCNVIIMISNQSSYSMADYNIEYRKSYLRRVASEELPLKSYLWRVTSEELPQVYACLETETMHVYNSRAHAREVVHVFSTCTYVLYARVCWIQSARRELQPCIVMYNIVHWLYWTLYTV